MGLRRLTTEEGGEPAEKRRRRGAVSVLLLLVLLLGLLAGWLGFLAISREPVEVGDYVLVGPSIRKPVEVSLTFGSAEEFRILTQPSAKSAAGIGPSPRNVQPGTRLSIAVGKRRVERRLILDSIGFWLLGP